MVKMQGLALPAQYNFTCHYVFCMLFRQIEKVEDGGIPFLCHELTA